MAYLKHNEINEKSVIVIDFKNGQSVPYFVDSKCEGGVSKVTMLMGEILSAIIKNPKRYFIGGTECYCIANEKVKGNHAGVIGYRKLSEVEKTEWVQKIAAIEKLKELAEIILKS